MTTPTLREQIFEALARLHIEHTPDCVHCRLRTAAVLPVVQAREAELTRRAEEAERALAVQVGLYRSAENDVTELIQRAEQAEAALRDLAAFAAGLRSDYMDGTEVHFMAIERDQLLQRHAETIATLDQPKETPR